MRGTAWRAMLSGHGRAKVLLAIYVTWCIASGSNAETNLLEQDARALLQIKAALNNPSQLSGWTNLSKVCQWDSLRVTCDPTGSRVVTLNLQNQPNPPGFSGTLSPWIGNLTELTRLDLSYNKISGIIPSEIGRLTKLVQMYLGRNSFYGDIPESIGNLIAATDVTVDHNELNGTVPDSLGNLKKMRLLDISFNKFNTTLPAALGNATSLAVLYAGIGTFHGPIPDTFGNLSFLTILTLNENNLQGTFPLSISSLCCIRQLRLQGNQLSGYLPGEVSAIPELSYNPQRNSTGFCSVHKAFPDLPECPPFTPGFPTAPKPKSSSSSRLVLGTVLGVVGGLVPLLAFIALLVRRRMRKEADSNSYKGLTSMDSRVQFYTMETLKAATNNFTNIIGRGGFGPVYKGVLSNGTIVAIKRLGAQSGQGETEFLTEVELLSRLHHHSLVNLIGYCKQKKEHLLVYEYKAGGSLDANLRPPGDTKETTILSWPMRVDIAVDVAEGLHYLHNGATPPVIHRDVKCSNVLIDSRHQGSLADFGLSKGNQYDATHVSTIVKGTPGYMDPEYVLLQQLTPATDVYAFGVVLLELISGQKAYDAFRVESWLAGATHARVSPGPKGTPSSDLPNSSVADWASQTVSTDSSTNPLDAVQKDTEEQNSIHPLLTQHARKYLLDFSILPEFVDPRLQGQFDKEQLEKLAQVAAECLRNTSKDRPTMRDICRMLPARSSPWQNPVDSNGELVLSVTASDNPSRINEHGPPPSQVSDAKVTTSG